MEISKRIDEIYRLLSTIPVTGDSVDRMALARQGLRELYTETAQKGDGANGDTSGC